MWVLLLAFSYCTVPRPESKGTSWKHGWPEAGGKLFCAAQRLIYSSWPPVKDISCCRARQRVDALQYLSVHVCIFSKVEWKDITTAVHRALMVGHTEQQSLGGPSLCALCRRDPYIYTSIVRSSCSLQLLADCCISFCSHTRLIIIACACSASPLRHASLHTGGIFRPVTDCLQRLASHLFELHPTGEIS